MIKQSSTKLKSIFESIIYTDLKKKRISDTAAKYLIKLMEDYKPIIAAQTFKTYLQTKYMQMLSDQAINDIYDIIWYNIGAAYSRLKQIAKDAIYKKLNIK